MYTRILFALIITAVLASAEEFTIAKIKVQRVAEEEYLAGFTNDKDELTYSINATGEASLWISPDGETTKRVTDPNYIHHYSPYLIPDNYYKYSWTSSKPDGEVRSSSPGVYSLLTSKSGNTWYDYVTQGTAWANQTNSLLLYVDKNYKIYDVKYEYAGKYSPGVKIDREENLVTFTASAVNHWDPPGGSDGAQRMSCIVSNIMVYAIEKLEDTIVDVRENDVKFRDSKGIYSMNGLRDWVNGVHAKQDKWSLFPAINDVQIGNNKLRFNTYNYIKGEGNNVAFVGNCGSIMEFNGGISGGWNIADIDMTTSEGYVILMVDAAVNQKVTLKRSVNGLTDFEVVPQNAYTDTYPNTVTFNGYQCYKLTVPLTQNATSEFYTVQVTASDPYIGFYVEKYYIGTNRVEYTKVIITDKNNQKWEVLGRPVP